jgi:hypothetical protein
MKRYFAWKTPSFLHVFMLVCIGALSLLLFRSMDAKPALAPVLTATSSTLYANSVKNNDDAVKAYLDVAQKVADIYHYVNGSFAGMCETVESKPYTLEEGMAALRYIKMVGATEVFCTTGDDMYMIEAQMPESKLFYCIDSTGAAVTQEVSREGAATCKSS